MIAVVIVAACVVTFACVLVPWLKGPGTYISKARPSSSRPGLGGVHQAQAIAVAAPVTYVTVPVVVACQHGAQEPAGREALRGRGVIPAIEAASVVPAVVLGEQEKVQR